MCCGWRTLDAVDTVVCAPDDVWKYHPKHVEQFPDISKLCNVASCCIGILLGAQYILHISRIRVKLEFSRQIFKKSSNTKFHENPSRGSRVVTCGRTDGHT